MYVQYVHACNQITIELQIKKSARTNTHTPLTLVSQRHNKEWRQSLAW